MSIDYDIPRTDHELPEGITELRPRVRPGRAAAQDELDEPINLPGAEVEDGELLMPVLARQPDEFVCDCCFLIQHRSRIRSGTVCADCA